MNKSESKYFATAAKMDEAFLQLLEKKDLAYITVKEICEKAGVNRSTFYLHYETIDDLLNECSRHIVNEFVGSMNGDAADFIKKLPDRPLDELYLVTPKYLTPYLEFIKENRRIFRVAIENSSALGMDSAYADLNRHVLMPILDRFLIPSTDRKYLMSFYIHGLMAIVEEWLKEDCAEPTEHVVAVMQRCVAKHEC